METLPPTELASFCPDSGNMTRLREVLVVLPEHSSKWDISISLPNTPYLMSEQKSAAQNLNHGMSHVSLIAQLPTETWNSLNAISSRAQI